MISEYLVQEYLLQISDTINLQFKVFHQTFLNTEGQTLSLK